jgi:hypothetical protein
MTITPSDQLRQSEIDGKPNLLQSTEYAPTTRAVDGDIDYVHFDSSKTLKAGSGAFQSSDIVTKKKPCDSSPGQHATFCNLPASQFRLTRCRCHVQILKHPELDRIFFTHEERPCCVGFYHGNRQWVHLEYMDNP